MQLLIKSHGKDICLVPDIEICHIDGVDIEEWLGAVEKAFEFIIEHPIVYLTNGFHDKEIKMIYMLELVYRGDQSVGENDEYHIIPLRIRPNDKFMNAFETAMHYINGDYQLDLAHYVPF